MADADDFSFGDLFSSRNEQEETVTFLDMLNPSSPASAKKPAIAIDEKKDKKEKKEKEKSSKTGVVDVKDEKKPQSEAEKQHVEPKSNFDDSLGRMGGFQLNAPVRTTAMVVYAPTERLKQTSLIVATTERDICILDLLNLDGKSDVKESGHSSAISSMVVHVPAENTSVDKSIHFPVLLTACRTDKFVQVWNLNTMEPSGRLEADPSDGGHTAGITSLAVFEPTDLFPGQQPLLVTGSTDKTAVVWFLHDGNYFRTLKDVHTDHITAMAIYAPSSTSYRVPGQSVYPMLITASRDKTAAVWNLSTGEKKHVLAKGHTEGITALAVQGSAGTKLPLLFSGSNDKSIVVWDLTTFTIIHTIQGAHPVSRIFFHAPHGIPLAELQALAGSKSKPSATEETVGENDADQEHDMFGLFSLEDDQSLQDGGDSGNAAPPEKASGNTTAAAVTTAATAAALAGASAAGGRPASARVEPQAPPAEKSFLNSFVKGVAKKARGVTSMKFGAPPVSGGGGVSDTASVTTAADSVDDASAAGGVLPPAPMANQTSPRGRVASTATAANTPLNKTSSQISTAAGPAKAAPAAPVLTAMMIVESSARRVVAVWDLNTCTRLRVVDEGIDALCVYNGSDADVTATPIAIAAIDDTVDDIWKLLDGKDVPYNPAAQAFLKRIEHERNVHSLAVSTPLEAGTQRSSNPFLVTGHAGGCATVWDMVTGKVKATFQQDGFGLVSSPITAVAIYDPIQFSRTPDHTKASLEKSASVKPNPHVITASKEAVTVWFANSASGEHRTLSHEALDGSVVSLVVYPGNGKADCPALVVATLKEGRVMVYDMDGKRRAREFESGHTKAVSCAALYIPKEQAENEDGSWNPLLLTASADVIVCDLFTGQRSSRRLDGHDNLVTCMAVYNPEDVDATPLVLTGSIDKCILIWDLKTGEKLQVLQFEHSIWCLSIYAPREAKVKGIAPLIVSSGKHGAQVWDLATGSLLRSLPAASAAGKGKTDPALSLAVFPYSFEPASLPVIITASSHQSESTLWNLNSKVSLLHSLEKAHSKEVNKVTSFALSMGAEEEPRPVAITISNDATAVIWDLETGIKDVVLQGGHSGPITQVVVHPGRASEIPRIITAGLGVEEDKNKVVLTVWNMETGKVEHALKGHSKEVTCLVAVSPKMQIVSGSQDGHVAVWDISTGTISKVLIGYPTFGAIAQPAVGAGTAALKSAESAAKSVFSFTSKSNAKGAGGKKGGASAEAAMTTQQKKLDLPPITAMALYSEGKEPRDTHFLLVAFKTNTIALWSVNDAQELKTFTHGTAITSLLALNAKYFSFPVVVATGGNTVVAWNVTSGAQLMTYSGHSDVVTASAVYLPVDTRALAVLVTASKDKSAILWDLRSGAKLRVLNHTAPINSVTVTTSGTCDGDFLVTTTTTGKNSTASVWLEYAMDLPPLSESVYSLFVTDSETRVNGTYNWDRIRNVASISKTFWVENGHLFTSVFTLKNRDKMMMVSFYKAFASALPGVIDRLPLVNGVSVLEHALEERIPVHQIILDAWSIALQQPCETFVQQVFHPCVGLDKNGLLLLAKYFPGLFIEFICKVEMVKSHALVHDKCSSYVISNSWIVEGMKPEVSSNMWSQAGYYSDTTNTSAQTVTAYMIPIIGVADISMLKAFVDTSTSLDDLSVFESHVGIAAFDYAWETFGRTVHLWTLFRYAVYLALFTTSLVTFDRLETSGDDSQRGVAWAMQGLVLLFTASYVFDEFAQFHDSHMRAQLAKFKARSKNALGAGMQSLQSLQNIFTAGNTTAAGADSSTGNTAGAKPAAAVESAKVRERRAKRGSLIENIPSGPLIEDVSSSSARASAHPGGREKMSKRGSALELTPSTSTSTTRNLTPPPPPTTRSSPSGDLLPPPPPAPGAAAESAATGTASAGKKELTFNFDADGAAAADGTLQHTLSGVFKTALKVDRKVLLRRFRNSRFMGLLNHLSEFWNLLDMLVIVLVFAGTILRCAHQGETSRSRCVLAVASVFAWFKLLYFMRPFKSSGLLVSMILQIMSDIKYFLIVLAIALTGFALAFWVISYPDHTLTFGSIPSAFLNTYQYMLGQGITADFEGTASPELGVVLLVMFMLFMMILMLNLLIALMGDSFSTIKSRGHAHWRREQASIILEQYSMVSEKTRNKVEENCHIHILKYFALTHDDELTDKQLLLSVKKTLDSRETEVELRGKIASLENKMDLLLALLSKKDGGGDAEKEKQKTSEPSAAADKEKAKE